MSSVKWNSKLNEILEKSFKSTCRNQGTAYQNIFASTDAFEGFNGQDIIDTGALKESQSLSFPSSFNAEFSWGMDYAIYVHEGYSTRGGNHQPGRPWTKIRKEFSFSDNFIENLGNDLK